MIIKKNKVTLQIEDCVHCPNATLKYDEGAEGNIMYCQTNRSLIMLREQWGNKPIPNWCPRLVKKTTSRGQRRKIGIIEDAAIYGGTK